VLRLAYDAKDSDRVAEYDFKLVDVDSDTLGMRYRLRRAHNDVHVRVLSLL